MKIQLNTDKHIQGDPSLVRHAEEAVTAALQHHAVRITRVEVHVSDLNAERTGGMDKRCLIEARLTNMPPLTASDNGNTVAEAVSGAARKLQRAIESAVSKRETH